MARMRLPKGRYVVLPRSEWLAMLEQVRRDGEQIRMLEIANRARIAKAIRRRAETASTVILLEDFG